MTIFRKYPSLFWLVAAFILTPFFATESFSSEAKSPGITVYVDAKAVVNGNGSRGKPFASIEHARNAIRQKRAETVLSPKTPVTVVVAPGVYSMNTSFTLDADDGGTENAPVTYRSSKPFGAKLIGGTVLEANTFKKVSSPTILKRMPQEARETVLVCDLKAAGIKNIPPMRASYQGTPSAPWLYCDRAPMTLARWPNAGLPGEESWAKFNKVIDDGLPKESGDATARKPHGGAFVYENDRPKNWNIDAGVWLHGYWCHDWSDEVICIKEYDAAAKTIRMAAPHNYGISTQTWGKEYRRFYAVNLLEELDSPGEWWVDREQFQLYFYPPEKLNDATNIVLAELTEPLVSCQNAKHLRWIGFSFEYGHGDGLAINDCEHVEILGCEIANFGGSGVSISGRENTVGSCDLFHLGRSGVSLNGGDRANLIPANNRVQNCHIHHFGQFQRTYAPGVGANGCGQIVRNNRIHDAPHNAVLYGGNEHLFERNMIYRVVMETGDAGAFYTGRDWTSQGNVIRHNIIADLGGGDEERVNTMGVYLDDCDSGDTIEGNIFYRAGRAMMIGGGRDNNVVSNLFIDCTIGLHIDARGMTWKQWNTPGGGWNLQEKAEALDYRGVIWSKRYPRLAKIMEEEPKAPLGNAIKRNLFVDCPKIESFDRETRKLLDRFDFQGNLIANSGNTEMASTAVPCDGFEIYNGNIPALTNAKAGLKEQINKRYDELASLRETCQGFEAIPLENIGLYRDEYRLDISP